MSRGGEAGDGRRYAVVNTGSSTLKLATFEASQGELHTVSSETFEWEAPEAMARTVRQALANLGPRPAMIGHRVVHGGSQFSDPVFIDDAVEKALEELVLLAPLHNGPALEAIRIARELHPDVPFAAVFDTAFHARRPAASRFYALPRDWEAEYGFRRYGFHGIAHASLARSCARALSVTLTELSAVTLQLGAGCSACAIRNGRSIETSMGYTPLEGLVMATRCGNIDPAIVLRLIRQGLDPEDIENDLNRNSGLRGIAGTGDMRDILAARADGDRDAALAVDLFTHRLVLEVGGFLTLLSGEGAIVFGGGIGRNSPEVRAGVAAGLEAWNVHLDPALNRSNRPGRISRESSRPVFVFETDEESMIAGQIHERFGLSS